MAKDTFDPRIRAVKREVGRSKMAALSDLALLEEGLKVLPARAAAKVAMRAAMRVLPVLAIRGLRDREPFGYWITLKRAQHLFVVFQCYQAATFVNTLTRADDAADAAALAARAVATAATSRTSDSRAAEATTPRSTARAAARAASLAARAAAAAAATALVARAEDATAHATARAAIRAATRANRAVATATVIDIAAAGKHGEADMFAGQPLWPDGVPENIQHLWRTLQDDLKALNAGFEVWIDWYQECLDGRPLDPELERKWALLPSEVLAKSPNEINVHLKHLRDAHLHAISPEAATCGGSDRREQRDHAVAQAGTGAPAADDLTEILAMREAIVEAVDDLVAALSVSPACAAITRLAERYKAAISADAISIDRLYSYGLRLENSRLRLERDIGEDDDAALALAAGEALDSVLAIHGPTLYATARGRQLLERARAFAQRDAVELASEKPKI